MKRAQAWGRRVMSCSIRIKIMACMLLIAFVAIFVSSVFFYAVLYDEQIKQAQASARLKVETASSTIEDTLTSLYTNMVSFVESAPMIGLYENVQQGVSITTNMMSAGLVELQRLARTVSLVDTVMLMTPQGEYISDKNIRLRPEHARSGVWEDQEQALFQWVSARRSPYVTPEQNYVALSFSIGCRKGAQKYVPYLTSEPDEIVFRLFMFFNYRKLTSLLQSSDADPLSITYLADAQMRPLSMLPEAAFYPVVSDEAFIGRLRAQPGQMRIAVGDEDYLVFRGETLVFGLHAIHIISERALLSGYRRIAGMTYLCAVITILAAVVLSAAMTNQLTRPLMRLTQSVRAIEEGDAREKRFIPRYGDEIGVLGTAINHMHDTIDRQILSIKAEERRRSRAEIKMMAQQINPHFIYNTLDCIRWEILRGNIEGSSLMVENLAKFLRLGFGRTGDTISIGEEIDRIEQYLNIMRERTSGALTLSSYVDARLVDWQVPRMILQPLVENAIKHGFPQELFETMQQAQEIFIRCAYVEENVISLCVEDNGVGMDIARAQEAVNLTQGDPSREKIGLRNSYLRLRAHFGADRIRIAFSSVPFVQNRVEFLIVQNADEADGRAEREGGTA